VIIGHDTTSMTVFMEENEGSNNTETNAPTTITMQGNSTVAPTITLVSGIETELGLLQNGTHDLP
jgi:hypothetical protein